MLTSSAGSGVTASARLGQIGQLAQQLDPDAATDLLHQLAVQHQRNGQVELAAETYEWLVDCYGGHPVSDAALWWLLRYYASGEIAWRLQQETQVVAGQRAGRGAFAPPMMFVTPAGQERSGPGLGRLGHGAAAPALAARLADESAFVAGVASDALGMIGEPAVEALAQMVAEENPHVRLLAVRALGRISAQSAVGPLFSVLEDSSYLVRYYAWEALEARGVGMVYLTP